MSRHYFPGQNPEATSGELNTFGAIKRNPLENSKRQRKKGKNSFVSYKYDINLTVSGLAPRNHLVRI